MGDSGAMFHPLPFLVRSYWEDDHLRCDGRCVGPARRRIHQVFSRGWGENPPVGVSPMAQVDDRSRPRRNYAIFLPDNLSDGYPIIERTFRGDLGLKMVAALMVAKFVASAISLDCGAPGGVFGPILIGATAGGTFHDISRFLLPRLTGAHGSYALVGMGAFLGGVTHAPLTALFLLFEMTRGDWTIAMPAMIATVVTLVVSRLIEAESIDTYRLAREGKTLAVSQERSV